jgi:hypothetical protein
MTGMGPYRRIAMSFEEDDGLSGYVAELLEGGYLEGAEEGVAKRFLANEPLTPDQQKVFDRYVIAKHDPGSCIRGCDIPWSEKYEAIHNGGMCSYCAHMTEKVMRD